jgi:two-component system chemotaxis response regulator CheY
MKVLIIEDSASQSQMIKKIILKVKDVEPILAEDALDGFAILRAIPTIELVILDNQMPYINGIDFLRKLRTTHPFEKLPILISSTEDNRDEYMESGADKAMIKPYNVKELIEFVSMIKNRDPRS